MASKKEKVKKQSVRFSTSTLSDKLASESQKSKISENSIMKIALAEHLSRKTLALIKQLGQPSMELQYLDHKEPFFFADEPIETRRVYKMVHFRTSDKTRFGFSDAGFMCYDMLSQEKVFFELKSHFYKRIKLLNY